MNGFESRGGVAAQISGKAADFVGLGMPRVSNLEAAQSRPECRIHPTEGEKLA